ncbi:MAG TPA: serine/threonine-protein kinase, partial [Nannocystis sp.]
MRADAILLAQVPTTSPIQHDPTEAIGLTPIDQVRRQVATALFGELVPLPQVGRFQVAKILGTGGMGVVYEAHDPQLGRKVALKLLQPMTTGERARERLLREAQAMAQLQHPNVVGVYEAGVHGDQVYVAMEYVENGTLGEWLRARPRTWQEIVDMLLQAGEGLSAAHAGGLVHRDFKPANILIGSGRARISDFGLARTTATAEDLERTAEDSSGMLLGAPLTRTGSLLGTPAYMAPEQLRGEPATPASDQFAFGVVLYESLYGHRPFQGESLGVLMTAIEEGRIARPERKLVVPAKLTAVIRRALARRPEQRFPNMASLLEALGAARRVRWVAPVLGAGIPAAVVVAGMAGLFMYSSPPPASQAAAAAVPAVRCDGGDALAGMWDAQRRAVVEQALIEADINSGTLASLDDYAT